MRKITLTSILLSLLFFQSCTKNFPTEDNRDALTTSVSNESVVTYPLDWEHIDFMPTPPGVPSVLVPWASGASRQFTPEVANDYKSRDGWTLVYNTFNTTTIHDNWYFMLYNKYRGLLRMYYYVPSNANYINSTNITHTLAIQGSYAASSPMMNFAGQDIVDVNTKSGFASNIEQWQVARSTWYMLQFELAYDKNMSTQSYSNFNFLWTLRSTQVTDIKLQGVVSGSLTGTVSTPGVNFTLSPTFTIDASSKKSTFTINGKSDADKVKNAFGQLIVNNLKTAISNGLQGIVKNLLSGIFKKSSTEENVNLKLKADVSLKGSLTSDVLLTSPAFSIPGYNQASTPGFIPAYNQPLGVFYISNRPTVKVALSSVTKPACAEEGPSGYKKYTFTLDKTSYQYIFNPAVTSIATISNIQESVMLPYAEALDIANCAGGFVSESIGDKTYYNVRSVITLHPTMGQTGNLTTPLYVRVTFDVVPHDGSPIVKVVKTFVVNAPLQPI